MLFLYPQHGVVATPMDMVWHMYTIDVITDVKYCQNAKKLISTSQITVPASMTCDLIISNSFKL